MNPRTFRDALRADRLPDGTPPNLDGLAKWLIGQRGDPLRLRRRGASVRQLLVRLRAAAIAKRFPLPK